MKVILEEPTNKFKLPSSFEANEVYEFEVFWYQPIWWSIQWYRFNMSICELLVPELKKEPNKIWFGIEKYEAEKKQTK